MRSGRISSIHRDPKNKYRYLIYVEDEFVIDVHEDILVKYHLAKGKEMDREHIEEIMLAEEENKAFLLALRYIGIRPRTSSQLMRYLVGKGFSEALATLIKDRCITRGYINDTDFAKQWIAERLRLKPRGAYALRMELQQKGIAKEIVEQAVKDIQNDDEIEAARKLIRSRIRRKPFPIERPEEQKLMAMLMRKGFSQSIALQIRNELRDGRLLDENEPDQ